MQRRGRGTHRIPRADQAAAAAKPIYAALVAMDCSIVLPPDSGIISRQVGRESSCLAGWVEPLPPLSQIVVGRLSRPETSLDDLVGAGEQRRWNSEAKRLGRFQINDQLEFGRLLNG